MPHKLPESMRIATRTQGKLKTANTAASAQRVTRAWPGRVGSGSRSRRYR